MRNTVDFNPIKKECHWEHEQKLFNYLEGKSVIIVGPAEYLIGQNKGEWIDSFDVVVRLNLSCPVPVELKKDVGSRTDVLYHTLVRDQHIKAVPTVFKCHTRQEIIDWKKDGVKWVVLKNNLNWLHRKGTNMRVFANNISGVIRWTNVSGHKYRRLTYMTRKGPNTGTIAIYHLLFSKLKSLHVVGCDFHKTGYYTGYGGFSEEQAKLGQGGRGYWGQAGEKSKKGPHDISTQIRYLKSVRDKRFKPDDVLEQIIAGVH